MLLSWRSKVRIFLGKDRLVVLQYRGGRRPCIHAKQVFPYAGEEAGWQPLLALLENVLKNNEWKKSETTVILSNRFVRYLVLPANEAPLSETEKTALVRHRFDEVYGEASTGWDLRLHEGAFGAPSLACAMPRELLDQLKAMFAGTPLRLTSVQPNLMTAFNACRKELGKEPCWFVLAERDNICVGLLQDGQWSSIRLRHVVSDWFAEAMLMLERESLLATGGNALNRVFVLAPETAGATAKQYGRWSISRLIVNPPPGIAAADTGNYAMAAAGL